MRKTRVIPILLIDKGGVYKTRLFKDPKYIGDPINTLRLFNDMEVDEVMLIDISATRERREPNYAMIEELVSRAFMPIAYGGGIKTVEQARKILNCGVEKVIINSAAQKSTELLTDCSKIFGSQSVVVCVDYKKNLFSIRKQYDHVTKKLLSISPEKAAQFAVKAGAGEVMFNCVDKDGEMNGLDLEFLKEVCNCLTIPIVICGGAGNLEHLRLAKDAGVSAIAGGSMFVYRGAQRGILINYPSEKLLDEYLN